MTVTYRLKDALADYLREIRPSESIAVVDATQRAAIALPTLAAEIGDPDPHSTALAHVYRCPVEIKLRTHAGDEGDYPTSEVNSWIDQIETSLNDPADVKALISDGVKIDYWLYGGSSQEWDESILETTFTAECLVSRI